MTINLGATDERHGPWTMRAERIAAVVDDHQIDIVAAQAAVGSSDGTPAPLTALTDRLPQLSHTAFAAADRHPQGWFGSAILSRYPITAQSVVPLSLRPGLEDANRRCLLRATLDGERPLTVISAHFSWVEAQAVDNVRETIETTHDITGEAVLAGDFNQPPASSALRLLEAAGWTDGWGSQPGGATFETGNLTTRIDYIWSRGSFANRPCDVRVVGGDGDAALSDHRGLVAKVGW